MGEVIVRRTEGLRGTVRAPPSKSYTHRAVIAASLAEGTSRVVEPLACDDTLATVRGCMALGAGIGMERGRWTVRGVRRPRPPADEIDCRESASTMRFLTPVASLAPGTAVLVGGPSLSRRPVEPLLDALRQMGVRCQLSRDGGRVTVTVRGGGIRGGEVSMVGDVSSQFVSGLLFACPLAERDTRLTLTTELESKPYVRMTIDVLERFGITVRVSDDMREYHIPSNQRYAGTAYAVPGDYSSAAFLLAAAAVTNSAIRVTNLPRETLQGDRVIVNILRDMGVTVRVGDGYVEARGGDLKATTVNARDIPDLVPAVAVLACYASGTTVILGTGRLRIKESDRAAALAMELGKMGAEVRGLADRLVIRGRPRLQGASVSSWDDHRIAMALAVAALGAEGETRILNPQCIAKSYPGFVGDLASIGAYIRKA